MQDCERTMVTFQNPFRRHENNYTEEDAPLLPAEADAILSQQMSGMSLEERNRALEDLHGVSSDKETEIDVEQALVEMEHWLSSAASTSIGDKKAYDLAASQSPEFVADRGFRLAFLRAEEFKPKEAAMRMAMYFSNKQEIFGPHLLGRHVTRLDLNQDDFAWLDSKMLRVLNEKDQAGRMVFVATPSLVKNHGGSAENHVLARKAVKSMWIFIHNQVDVFNNEDMQRRGVVVVIHNPNLMWHRGLGSIRFMAKIRQSLPFRIVGAHFCLDNPTLLPLIPLVRLSLEKSIRFRFRYHVGQAEFAALQGYGIPPHALQATKTAPEETIPIHLSTLDLLAEDDTYAESASINSGTTATNRSEAQEFFENEPPPSSAYRVKSPGPFDVLCGRGKSRDHSGNKHLLAIIEMHRAEYEQSGKFQKTALAELIIGLVEDSGGKFLDREIGSHFWVEIPKDTAREKVSKIFRRLRGSRVPRKKSEE